MDDRYVGLRMCCLVQLAFIHVSLDVQAKWSTLAATALTFMTSAFWHGKPILSKAANTISDHLRYIDAFGVDNGLLDLSLPLIYTFYIFCFCARFLRRLLRPVLLRGSVRPTTGSLINFFFVSLSLVFVFWFCVLGGCYVCSKTVVVVDQH